MADARTLDNRVADAVSVLKRVAAEFSPAVFANSFGAEDMVLTHLIVREHVPIRLFSIDTGRLPVETYELMARAEQHYGIDLGLIFPDAASVETVVRTNGINGFYRGIEQRKACCEARKVTPLKRALAGKRAWVTGLRSAQSQTREELPIESFDASHGLHKFNPLATWSEADVWEFLRSRGVPYNLLHDHGYPSIGCAPCTRAVAPGEDIRAGRWWWEAPGTKECGLHFVNGRLQRIDPQPSSSDSGPFRS